MATSQRTFFSQIGGTIQELLSRFDSEGHFAIVRLMRLWPQIVGETIAARTEVSSLKFHTAVVKVSGAMWIQELNLAKPQILARVRETMHDDTVREIRFVQGRMSRRARPHLKSVSRGPRRSIELPELKDPELRRAFESLIEAWGRAPR
jgi:predicted nucleic acid-binding Zn ribbon protein